MKRLFFLIMLLASAGFACGQQDYRFSFPSPEIRVDTIMPLSAYRLSVIKPLDVTGSLKVKGTRLPSMFMFECVDSINNHRFALTKNGYLISGTHHNPTTNVDGLVMMGRGNTLFGADAVAIGKQVVNEADTTMALGYYYTVPETKHNMTIIGYGNNRIEMAADSGRFVGNWKLGGGGSGGIVTESDPTVPSHVKAITTTNVTNWNTVFGWGNHSTQGYLKSYTETDPVWTADKANYYTQTLTRTLVKDTAAVLRGLIKTAGGGTPVGDATTTSKGIVQVGSGLSVANGIISVTTPTDNNYTTAEKTKLAGLSNYTLPVGSATTLGGVKVGDGLNILSGVISNISALNSETNLNIQASGGGGAFQGFGNSKGYANQDFTIYTSACLQNFGSNFSTTIKLWITNTAATQITGTIGKDAPLQTKIKGGVTTFTIEPGRTVVFTMHLKSDALYIDVSEEYF